MSPVITRDELRAIHTQAEVHIDGLRELAARLSALSTRAGEAPFDPLASSSLGFKHAIDEAEDARRWLRYLDTTPAGDTAA